MSRDISGAELEVGAGSGDKAKAGLKQEGHMLQELEIDP